MIAVELSSRQLLDVVKQLSPAKKLELNEVIWVADILMPQRHQDILNERIEYKANSKILLDWTLASKDLKV